MKVVVKIKFNVPYTQFKNPFVEERLTQQWIEQRLSVFMKYTYKSLVRQSNQQFKAFVLYDPKSEEVLKEELNKYDGLNTNIVFTHDFEKDIEEYIGNEACFAMLYLDSDNMIHPTFVQRVYDMPIEDTEVIISQRGYVYEEINHRVSLYYYGAPDTFYTLIYPTKQYFEGFRYNYPCNQYGDVIHGNYLLKLKYRVFKERMFIVTIHGKNVSHDIERMFGYKTVQGFLEEGIEKKSVLEDYQIEG
ncbi:MAG: glycosyltransferase [Cellulosilyticaceae bacterium]